MTGTVIGGPRPRPQRTVQRHRPWWGRGAPPEERWPGVSVRFDASWSSARRRWETHGGRYYFDATAADMAVRFFPLFLSHHIGEFAGQPFTLRADQAMLLTRPIFGWKRSADGLRRIRKVFAFCPKGWGKSPWGAGTGIYLARYDHEPAAEVYAVAADIQQARIVHESAKIMVEHSSPQLREGCQILKNAIVWDTTASGYYVLSSDASTKHGFRPHGVIFDEMHAQKTRDLYEALLRSMVKRRQPLMVIITHAGTDEEGICYEEYELAKRVLAGNVQLDTVLPVIFEIGKNEDWQAAATWRRVNPGHGITVQHQAIVEEAKEAAAEPRKRNDFLRYHCNKWTSQATAWIPIEWWDACEGPLDDVLLQTLECGAGLDLAQKWDLASFVVVFRRYLAGRPESIKVVGEEASGAIVQKAVDLNYELFVRPYFWIPENSMKQHEREDGIAYSTYRDLGLLTATEGDVIDYQRIYDDITTKIVPRYPRLKEGTIGYDPAFATDLAGKLREPGNLRTVEVPQNYAHLSEPSQIVEALVKGRRVHHDGHRVLHWNWQNVAVKTDDAKRIKPIKNRNPAKRCDGVIALIMGDKAVSLNVKVEKSYTLHFVGGPKPLAVPPAPGATP